MAFSTTAGAGGTTLAGTTGVDALTVTPSSITQAVTVDALGGNDVFNTITTSAASYTVNLGGGNDTASLAGATASAVRAGSGNDAVTVTAALGTSDIFGGEGNDTITTSRYCCHQLHH